MLRFLIIGICLLMPISGFADEILLQSTPAQSIQQDAPENALQELLAQKSGRVNDAGTTLIIDSRCSSQYPYFCNSASYGQFCCSKRYYNPCDQLCYDRSSDFNCNSYVRCTN